LLKNHVESRAAETALSKSITPLPRPEGKGEKGGERVYDAAGGERKNLIKKEKNYLKFLPVIPN